MAIKDFLLETYASRPFTLVCLKPWSRRSFSVGISTRRLKGVRHMHPERGNWVYTIHTWVNGTTYD